MAVVTDTMSPNAGLAGLASIRMARGISKARSCASARGRPRRGGLDHLHVERLGQLHARQPDAAGEPGAAHGHVAQLPLRGIGVGLINLLVYLVIAVFLAGLMVGRTPEYLGKKLEAREMKTGHAGAAHSPHFHPGADGITVAMDWGKASMTNPGSHGLSQVLYEYTSASANNGSGFEGWATRRDSPTRSQRPSTPAVDVITGLIMVLCRFVPIVRDHSGRESGAKATDALHGGDVADDTVTFAWCWRGRSCWWGRWCFCRSRCWVRCGAPGAGAV